MRPLALKAWAWFASRETRRILLCHWAIRCFGAENMKLPEFNKQEMHAMHEMCTVSRIEGIFFHF